MAVSEQVMFLDESGDHSLDKIDPQYPMFVLGGVIVGRDYADAELSEEVRGFKRQLFGREDIILHTADITRNRNGFEALQDAAFRQHFYGELNALMRRLEFRVVACAILKDVHLDRYGIDALDPYVLCLNVLVERFCFEVGDTRDGGEIIVERRGPPLDRQLDLAWQGLRVTGTRYVSGAIIRKRFGGLTSREK